MSPDAAGPPPTEVGPSPQLRRWNVRLSDFVLYRGDVGMFAWLLHRITGVAILLFLFAHIIDTSLIGWGPEAYDRSLALYRRPLFRVGEILLFGAVIYHGLNGLRVVAIDFWPPMNLRQKPLFAVVFVVGFILFVIVASWMSLAMNW